VANQPDVTAKLKEPSLTLSEIEELGALRECLDDLDPNDRTLTSQLTAITERRWKAAAEALGMSESTLRSKWGRILERLRGCVERKTGIRLAPGKNQSDS
jgi:DNA-directed RNA polymerase specialized sigma24 family protein